MNTVTVGEVPFASARDGLRGETLKHLGEAFAAFVNDESAMAMNDLHHVMGEKVLDAEAAMVSAACWLISETCALLELHCIDELQEAMGELAERLEEMQ